jgi:hypothetical protein
MSVLISPEELVFTIRKTKRAKTVRGDEVSKQTESVGESSALSKSILRIEQHRALITKRIIRGTITRMRRFDMNGKVKPKKLKIAEFAILDESERVFRPWTEGLRVEDPDTLWVFRTADPEERLYRFGGFSSDSE